MWYGLAPVVLAVGPTLIQRRLTLWSMRCGYIIRLGQFLLGYSSGVVWEKRGWALASMFSWSTAWR